MARYFYIFWFSDKHLGTEMINTQLSPFGEKRFKEMCHKSVECTNRVLCLILGEYQAVSGKQCQVGEEVGLSEGFLEFGPGVEY